MKRWFFLFLFLFVLASGARAEDDFQSWNQVSLKVPVTDKVSLTTFMDARLTEDVRELGIYYFSERLNVKASEHWTLGLNYTYLLSRSGDEYRKQDRVELEANPHGSLGPGLEWDVRNRLEFRWIEDQGADNWRFRQRWTLKHPFKGRKFLKAIYANSEFFYDQKRNIFSENRSVPLGLSWKFTNNLSLQTYYLIQSQKTTAGWRTNHVLGLLWGYVF